MKRLTRFRVALVPAGKSQHPARARLDTAAAAACFFSREIGDHDREAIAVVFLSAGFRPVGWELAHLGLLNNARLHPRELFKGAILANAAFVAVGHNHPSDDVEPSRPDYEAADRLRRAGELLGIPLTAFVVVTPSGQWSTIYDALKR